MKKIIITVLATLLAVGTVSAATFSIDEVKELVMGDTPVEFSLGSVTVGNEYMATTTVPGISAVLPTSTSPFQIKKGYGALGSYIVLEAGTAAGEINIYDATTTNPALRNNTATTSIHILSMPTDLTAGTYVFDIGFNDGLVADWTGTIGTTTFTFR